MSYSEITDFTLREAADVLLQQLIYSGEVPDISLANLKSCKPPETQSLTFLDSSVYLAYSLLMMLEKWVEIKREGDLRQAKDLE